MANIVYSISIRWIATKTDLPAVETVLSRMGDWYRYNSYQWFAASKSNSTEIFDELWPIFKPRDSLLVTQLDFSNHRGVVPKDFKEWIDKYNK